ncbi:MAG TPA: WYL domain-containing protein, partial [Candidatus Dojkabacteria bacterium]|nr:WYL domain-containing protein [Candidatus Dojkabacteria bacterium]
RNMELSSKYKKDVFTNLALHRVKGVKVLDDKYEYPKGLDTKDFFSKNAFNFEEDVFAVVLKFPAHAKDYIAEREWYPNQKLKRLKDGSIQLSFESDINMMLLGWIRRFGPDVEVLEPEELREKVVEGLKRNLEQYLQN